MEQTAQLIAHVDSGKVSYAQLAEYVPPPSTRHWRPVAHKELVDTLKDRLEARQLEIVREEYAVSHNGLKLFGVMDLKGDLVPGVGRSIGFRHANDKQIALHTVAGGRVFVCDNMALHGSLTVLKQKHVWGFNLKNLIERGLDSYHRNSEKFADGIRRMAETVINDEKAQAILSKALFDGTITFQTFKVAYDTYFNKAPIQPDAYADSAPRSIFGLHNALTRALKLSTPNVQFNSTIELTRELGVWQ